MHFLIPVFFNAPNGGLHENVRDTAKFLLSRKHRVTVVCKAGAFAEQIRCDGGEVITTDFGPLSFAPAFEAVGALHQEQPIDLVHAHPFAARRFGMIAAQALGIPCVVTMHGQYLDALQENIDDLDAVFAVSEGIRQYLVAEQKAPKPEKFHVVPNVPDARLFKAVATVRHPARDGKVIISLVTRLDKDKAFILELFLAAVGYAAQRYPGRIHWQVVGQGALQKDFAARLESARGENSVGFTGWLQGEALRDAYCRSDAVIGPGRCALEAMSCGVPTIALGSKGYVGLVSPETWQMAVFTNFGGVGDKSDGYAPGTLEQDLDRVMTSVAQRRRLGRFGRQVVRQFFNATQTHQKLLGHYSLVMQAHKLHPRRKVPAETFLELRLRGLSLEQPEPDQLEIALQCEPAEGLEYAWYLYRNGEVLEKHPYSRQPERRLQLPGSGRYKVRCFVRDVEGRRLSFFSREISVD